MDTEIKITAKEKYNPKNRMEAWFFQLIDDVKLLRTYAHLNDREKYNKHCDFISEMLKQAKQP